MARIDPNQAAAAATNQPIPGADPLGQSMIDMQTQAPGVGTGPSQELVDAAVNMGMNPNAMTPDEWSFVDTFVGGGLASIQPDGDPDNPLIPGEDTPIQGVPVPLEIPTQAADAPSPVTGADARVGPATTPEATGVPVNVDGAPVVPSQPSPETIETPGRPAFEIPSPIPPAPAVETPDPNAQQPALVALPDGSVVTLETYYAIQAAQQQQQPFAQQQPTPGYAPAPLNAPPAPMAPAVPNAWSATPGEWVDERAQYEYQQLQAQIAAQNQALAPIQQQMQEVTQQNALLLEQAQANSRQAIDVAVNETVTGYAGARGLTPEQAQGLLDDATRLGIVGVYSQQFPGDPRRAVAAAMENIYNNTPEYRALDQQRQVEAQRQADADTERRKAFAGQTTGTPGSVPRAAQPAARGDIAAQNQGIVALIEADSAYQAQQAQRGR